MNKRIRKKRSLLPRIEALELENELLMKLQMQQSQEIERLRNVVERNAQATNSRFDYLEKKVADKVSKKSWFSKK